MTNVTHPACITLLGLIANACNSISTIFDPQTEDFKACTEMFKVPLPINENPLLLESPNHIHYLQILYLTSISMYGGIFIPEIHRLTQTENGLKMTWKNQTTDHIQWGQYDKNCTQLINHIQKKCFKQTHDTVTVTFKSIHQISQLIQQYTETLQQLNAQIAPLTDHPSNLSDYLKNPNPNTLFLLISALPIDQINALCLHIHADFPDTLTCKSSSGQTLNIQSFLGTNSQDITQLLEKIDIYLALSTNNPSEVIQTITEEKTLPFLRTSLQNTALKKATFEQITNIKESQIDTRIKLYYLISHHLNLLLGHTT